MIKSQWVENPGVYLGREVDGGVVITGPMSPKKANEVVVRSVKNKEGRVVMYKSENGELPVLEIIMELFYREAMG